MRKAVIAGTIVIAGLLGLGLTAWSFQLGSPEDPLGAPQAREVGSRLLTLLESDRAKTELNLTEDQVQRLRQVIVETEKSSIKTRADLAVRGIELRELLRVNNPDRNAAMNKVQEISNLRGEMMKQYVGALLSAKAVLTPEQQKKFQTFIERQRAANIGLRTMGAQPRNMPVPPPQPRNPPAPPMEPPRPSGR